MSKPRNLKIKLLTSAIAVAGCLALTPSASAGWFWQSNPTGMSGMNGMSGMGGMSGMNGMSGMGGKTWKPPVKK